MRAFHARIDLTRFVLSFRFAFMGLDGFEHFRVGIRISRRILFLRKSIDSLDGVVLCTRILQYSIATLQPLDRYWSLPSPDPGISGAVRNFMNVTPAPAHLMMAGHFLRHPSGAAGEYHIITLIKDLKLKFVESTEVSSSGARKVLHGTEL